jgi:hypothetical protein
MLRNSSTWNIGPQAVRELLCPDRRAGVTAGVSVSGTVATVFIR